MNPPRSRGARRVPKQLLLRVTMREIDPPIWRQLRVPDAFTLHQLHRILATELAEATLAETLRGIKPWSPARRRSA